MTQTSFYLAIDLGTSRVAAATARVAADGSIVTAPFALGRKSDSAATVVFVGDDGDLSFGDTAERRGVAQPERLIREFKRSVGDEVPISVGGTVLRAETLYAQTVADIVRLVAEREGAEPEGIALTHPTAWGGHRLDLIRSALAAVGVGAVELISEPEAAARHYEAARPLEMGQTLAVYDLGGGTFDTVLLRKEIDGTFDIVGEPIGIEDLGGADFDDAVLRHVISASAIDVAALSVDDPDTRLALSQLRRECVDAKEALSFDSDATIPVLVPPQRTSVRLTRSEFEGMIAASIDRTIDALDEVLESAGLEPEQLESILLIGGSSRIPQIAQRLSERFDRPIAVDADPKAAIALGAARTALVRSEDRRIAPGGLGALAVLADEPAGALAVPQSAPAGELVAVEGPAFPASPEGSSLAKRSSPFLLAGAAVTIAAAIVFASTLSAGSRSADPSVFPSTSATPTPSSSSAPASNEAAAAPPLETVAETKPVADQGSNGSRSSGPQNPRRQATQRAVQQSEQQIKAAAPTAKPTSPASNAQGGGTGGGTGGGSSTTPANTDTTNGGGTPTDGTDDTESPAPTNTESPAPTNTESPAPTNTESPAPTNTESPAPTNTESPAPTNTESPAPTNTESPAPTNTESPPASEPPVEQPPVTPPADQPEPGVTP